MSNVKIEGKMGPCQDEEYKVQMITVVYVASATLIEN